MYFNYFPVIFRLDAFRLRHFQVQSYKSIRTLALGGVQAQRWCAYTPPHPHSNLEHFLSLGRTRTSLGTSGYIKIMIQYQFAPGNWLSCKSDLSGSTAVGPLLQSHYLLPLPGTIPGLSHYTKEPNTTTVCQASCRQWTGKNISSFSSVMMSTTSLLVQVYCSQGCTDQAASQTVLGLISYPRGQRSNRPQISQ